jgi:hypothetical protein
MFNFSDLVLEQLVLELRYENGYLYWDNSGKIWREILSKWPFAKADTINVKDAKIVIPEKEISLIFSSERIVLTQNYAAGVTDMGEFGDSAVSTIRELLDISVFTRIGNRFIYMLKLPDEKESLDLILRTGFFAIPQGKVSNVGDSVKSPAVRFQIIKGDDMGYGIRLEHTNRTLNIQLPKPIKVDRTKFITSGLMVDIDFYTLKPIECGNVRVHELIKKNHREMELLITGLFR